MTTPQLCIQKMGHVSKTTPLLGVICHSCQWTGRDKSPFWQDLILSPFVKKFQSSSFSHSWDMDGAPKIKNVSRDVTTPLSCRFVIRRLGLARVNLYTKYEVSMLTHYEDMNGDEKCKNWGGLGARGHPRSSETSPFDRAHMISYSTLIETICLSWTVFEL